MQDVVRKIISKVLTKVKLLITTLDRKCLNEAIKQERSQSSSQTISNTGKFIYIVLEKRDEIKYRCMEYHHQYLARFKRSHKFNRMPFRICSTPEVFQKKSSLAFENNGDATLYFNR